MIMYDLKAVFIHIPKTGGTTIGNLFHPDLEVKDRHPASYGSKYKDYKLGQKMHTAEHKTYYAYKRILEKQKLDIKDFYIFTFIRNPYDRVYSSWKFFYDNISLPKFNDLPIDVWSVGNFETFVTALSETHRYKKVVGLQTDYFDINNCNFIGRYETFREDLKKLLRKFNINKRIPYFNATTHRDEYKNAYNNKLQNIIYNLYKEDFIEFGYDYSIIGG